MEEFFKQGEKEKELGLPCSPLCDRENTLVAESQIGLSIEEERKFLRSIDNFSRIEMYLLTGFIQYIVEPSFIVMGDMLEKVLKSMATVESEATSPLLAPNSAGSSSPSPSLGSSHDSTAMNDEKNRFLYFCF